MSEPTSESRVEPSVRVSTLELFFDLVFVFTITQFTDVLAYKIDLEHALQVGLLLAIIWWMYGGYAWLTNMVAPSSTTRRTLLLTGMGGFLVIALGIPEAFGDTGWAFGLGYFAVSLAHTALFLYGGDRSTVRAMMRLAPLNLGSSALVLAGGLAPAGPWRWGLWIAALAVQIATPYLNRLEFHSINPAHFVERHGLVVIVVIGESIVAIGLGFRDVPFDGGGVLVAVLGLCIAYYLWWAYFSGDEERSEHALAGVRDPRRRALLAIWAWQHAHLVMFLGVIALAAGVKRSVGHAFDPLDVGPAVALGSGTALFLIGHALFLRLTGLSGAGFRLAAAAGVLLTIPLGTTMAVVQLALVPMIMAAAMITEDMPRVRRTGSTALHTFGRTPAEGD